MSRYFHVRTDESKVSLSRGEGWEDFHLTVLKFKMTTARIIAAPLRVLSQKTGRI